MPFRSASLRSWPSTSDLNYLFRQVGVFDTEAPPAGVSEHLGGQAGHSLGGTCNRPNDFRMRRICGQVFGKQARVAEDAKSSSRCAARGVHPEALYGTAARSGSEGSNGLATKDVD